MFPTTSEVTRCYWGMLGSISLMLCLHQQICTELGCSLIAKPINDFLNPHPKHLVSVPPYAKLQELGVFCLTMLINDLAKTSFMLFFWLIFGGLFMWH